MIGCGCKATIIITEDSSRPDIWLEVLGKLSFPLINPEPFLNETFPGKRFFAGDATALTAHQKKKLIKVMSEKFAISKQDIEKSMEDGLVPILDENIKITFCELHKK